MSHRAGMGRGETVQDAVERLTCHGCHRFRLDVISDGAARCGHCGLVHTVAAHPVRDGLIKVTLIGGAQ